MGQTFHRRRQVTEAARPTRVPHVTGAPAGGNVRTNTLLGLRRTLLGDLVTDRGLILSKAIAHRPLAGRFLLPDGHAHVTHGERLAGREIHDLAVRIGTESIG